MPPSAAVHALLRTLDSIALWLSNRQRRGRLLQKNLHWRMVLSMPVFSYHDRQPRRRSRPVRV